MHTNPPIFAETIEEIPDFLKNQMDQELELQLHDDLGTFDDWSPSAGGATIVWRDLSIYAADKNKHKRIINNVSGAVKPGSLVALMGSSGAGKTTLMAALGHRSPAGTTVDGDILVGGRPIGDYMHRLSGYMHQDDLFGGTLTVLEHMQIMSRFKMDRRTSNTARTRRINSLLRNLGLYGCRHTRIGVAGDEKVLSGGEKKRLAFATELITNPAILYCDEPTTGLDAFSAQKLVSIMKLVASEGRTVVCTIHQPSSEVFSMFDQLILLAEGRIAYNGKSADAAEFFTRNGYPCPVTYNPADHYIKTLAVTPGFETASKQAIKRLCDEFAVSDVAREADVNIHYEFSVAAQESLQYERSFISNDFHEPFVWTKLYWLTFRYFREVLRDPKIQMMRILQKIVRYKEAAINIQNPIKGILRHDAIAVMSGLCFLGTLKLSQNGIQSVQGALFILVSENTFSPMYAMLGMLPLEFPLFMREYRSGLYPASIYYVARTLAVLPFMILEPALFSLILYWFAGLRASSFAFLITLLSTILVQNVATSCGCFFSCAFNSVPIAMAWLVPFDYVLMITSGLFVNLRTLPNYLQWLKYLSWLMYSNEAMSIVQWDGIDNIICESGSPDAPCLREGTEVLSKYSFSENNLWADITAMVGLYLSFHTLAYLCLLRRARKK